MKFSLAHTSSNFPELLIVPIAKNNNNNSCFQAISDIVGLPAKIIQSDFGSELKESHTIYFNEGSSNKKIVLLGLGKSPGLQEVLSAFRSFFHRQKSKIPPSVGISFLLNNLPSSKTPIWLEAAVNGALLGEYEIGLYKTDKKSKKNSDGTTIQLFVDIKQMSKARKALDKGLKIAETQLQIFDLVNAPANKKNATDISKLVIPIRG